MRIGIYIIILLVPVVSWAQQTAPSITVTATSCAGANCTTPVYCAGPSCTFPRGTAITLMAKFNDPNPKKPAVLSFFYGLSPDGVNPPSSYPNYIGQVTRPFSTTPLVYILPWDNPPQSGDYYVVAYVGDIGVAGTGTQIDMVADPALPGNQPNPAADPAFGSFSTPVNGVAPGGLWQPGDNQMCMAAWPYNGKTAAKPDGTCQEATKTTAGTIDSLDDTMHIFSDFLTFANNTLYSDPTTISAAFNYWFQNQAATWIMPNPPGTPNLVTGRLLNIYYPDGYPGVGGVWSGRGFVVVDKPNEWNNVITKWLNNDYTPANKPAAGYAWCLPPEDTQPAFFTSGANGTMVPTAEHEYIIRNSDTVSPWGDLSHVISCLNYNAGPAENYYQTCLNWLTKPRPSGNSNACPAALANVNTLVNTPCDPSGLGRSLNTVPQPAWDTSDPNRCDPTYLKNQLDPNTASFAKWVSDSLMLFNDEKSKFSKRSAFLTDLYTRARKMQAMFAQADYALHNFFKPCGAGADPQCKIGGPAAQLIYAYLHPQSASSLPNSVIYGWRDPPPSRGKSGCGNQGCAHIVKIMAFSAGRQGSQDICWQLGSPIGCTSLPGGMLAELQSDLPHAHEENDWQFTFLGPIPFIVVKLENRDGLSFVSVRRWDEDHHNDILFPSGHLLWETRFNNPADKLNMKASVSDIFNMCVTDYGGLVSQPIGFGLQSNTVKGLTFNNKLSPPDMTALGNSFMLNDNGNGNIDPNGSSPQYRRCMDYVTALLNNGGMESHACARYIASLPQGKTGSSSSASGNDDENDYTVKFVDCEPYISKGMPRSKP